MQNLNTRPATRKVGQSTEIVKLLRIQASDTHVVEFDNVDTRFNDCNNWQVMAGGKRVLFSNRMYERFSDVKSELYKRHRFTYRFCPSNAFIPFIIYIFQ